MSYFKQKFVYLYVRTTLYFKFFITEAPRISRCQYFSVGCVILVGFVLFSLEVVKKKKRYATSSTLWNEIFWKLPEISFIMDSLSNKNKSRF